MSEALAELRERCCEVFNPDIPADKCYPEEVALALEVVERLDENAMTELAVGWFGADTTAGAIAIGLIVIQIVTEQREELLAAPGIDAIILGQIMLLFYHWSSVIRWRAVTTLDFLDSVGVIPNKADLVAALRSRLQKGEPCMAVRLAIDEAITRFSR